MLHGYITYMTQFIRKTPDLLEGQAILLDHSVFFCAMFLKPLDDGLGKSLDFRNLIRFQLGFPVWIKLVIVCIVCEFVSGIVQETVHSFRFCYHVMFHRFSGADRHNLKRMVEVFSCNYLKCHPFTVFSFCYFTWYPLLVFFRPNQLSRSAVLVDIVAVYDGSYTAAETPAIFLDEHQEPVEELVL